MQPRVKESLSALRQFVEAHRDREHQFANESFKKEMAALHTIVVEACEPYTWTVDVLARHFRLERALESPSD